jgi:Fic family protein
MKCSYKETIFIKKLIDEIEALKIVFDNYPIHPNVEKNILRKSILKSSLYSARIEGNKTRFNEAQYIGYTSRSKNIRKLEIFNLLTAYNYIISKSVPKKLSQLFIKKLHRMVMKNISGYAGCYRQEPWAIFNQAGVAVYLAPAHFRIPELMGEFLVKVNAIKHHSLVRAIIAQFIFEKIHPFADGNGRVGRLITSSILQSTGYNFRGLIPYEEYVDNHRDLYYSTLEESTNVTPFVRLYLEGIINQAKNTLDGFKYLGEEKPEDSLSLRRTEILQIVREHPYSSFDFLKRRFCEVNEKTLHYDLKKLQQEKYILKNGVSRGATYFAKKQ